MTAQIDKSSLFEQTPLPPRDHTPHTLHRLIHIPIPPRDQVDVGVHD